MVNQFSKMCWTMFETKWPIVYQPILMLMAKDDIG